MISRDIVERADARLAELRSSAESGDRDFALWLAARHLSRIGIMDEALAVDLAATLAAAHIAGGPPGADLFAQVDAAVASLPQISTLSPSAKASVRYALLSAHQNTIVAVRGCDAPNWPWKERTQTDVVEEPAAPVVPRFRMLDLFRRRPGHRPA